MAERKATVRFELTRDMDKTRLERSPGENFLANVAGNNSRCDMKAVCSVCSTLSLMRVTTKLRAICTIARPTVALASRVAIGII